MAPNETALPLPFELPLVAARIPSQVLQSILAGLGPRFDESNLDEEARAHCVKRWEDIIRDKERANPGWMKQWLGCYGPYALEALSDTQFAAVLGIPLHSLRRERLDWDHLIHLVDVKVFPAASWFCWNNRERKTKQTRKHLSQHKSWADYQPEHKSPLRQVWTPVNLESPQPTTLGLTLPLPEFERLQVTHSTPTTQGDPES